MSKDRAVTESQLNEVRQQISALLDLEKTLQNELRTPEDERREVASQLHSKQCRLNHIDQCGWELETWEGNTPAGNSARLMYLQRADRIIAAAHACGISVKDAMRIRGL